MLHCMIGFLRCTLVYRILSIEAVIPESTSTKARSPIIKPDFVWTLPSSGVRQYGSSRRKYQQVIKILIGYGADPDTNVYEGYKPLLCAEESAKIRTRRESIDNCCKQAG